MKTLRSSRSAQRPLDRCLLLFSARLEAKVGAAAAAAAARGGRAAKALLFFLWPPSYGGNSMGWRSHGHRALLRHHSSLASRFPFSPSLGTQSCSQHPVVSSLRASVVVCPYTWSRGSSIKPRYARLASKSLFSCSALRFESTLSGLPGFSRKVSSLGSSGKAGRLPGSSGGNAKSWIGGVDHVEVAQIVELVRAERGDLESTLNQMNLRLSRPLVGEVLLTLNTLRVSALRFFEWVLRTQPDFKNDPGICSLIVDNLGRLQDYGRMLVLLQELSRGGHCLTGKAFKFLAFGCPNTAKDSIRRVVEVLNMAGGSCRGSGIYSLIKFLCDSGSFDLAVFVMEETARKTSYYNVLIAAKCRNGDFRHAYDLFDEMRKKGCDPSTKSYNYLLGSLFKNDKVAEACELLESMEELGYHPDSVTFEVIIFHACRVNRMDFAVEFLGRMLADGIMLRFTTHAAFIKGYFRVGRAVDAHKYVVDMCERDKCSANVNYSLLASLFWRSGRIIEAGAFLFEMMEKNLKPNFSIFVKVTKDLYKLGRGDLASDLKERFSKFHQDQLTLWSIELFGDMDDNAQVRNFGIAEAKTHFKTDHIVVY
ncbi:hypothetical protein Taro_052058 [Colocasia esculenta]|uniref:Pentatricopeptide repeat-containing protein n=1 Tax=Colocasia esculenta TaxID=4460 RepID=A0A843XJ35_COLES|nr:hypothetical protein [Colocasia esculenta]